MPGTVTTVFGAVAGSDSPCPERRCVSARRAQDAPRERPGFDTALGAEGGFAFRTLQSSDSPQAGYGASLPAVTCATRRSRSRASPCPDISRRKAQHPAGPGVAGRDREVRGGSGSSGGPGGFGGGSEDLARASRRQQVRGDDVTPGLPLRDQPPRPQPAGRGGAAAGTAPSGSGAGAGAERHVRRGGAGAERGARDAGRGVRDAGAGVRDAGRGSGRAAVRAAGRRHRADLRAARQPQAVLPPGAGARPQVLPGLPGHCWGTLRRGLLRGGSHGQDDLQGDQEAVRQLPAPHRSRGRLHLLLQQRVLHLLPQNRLLRLPGGRRAAHPARHGQPCHRPDTDGVRLRQHPRGPEDGDRLPDSLPAAGSAGPQQSRGPQQPRLLLVHGGDRHPFRGQHRAGDAAQELLHREETQQQRRRHLEPRLLRARTPGSRFASGFCGCCRGEVAGSGEQGMT